VPEGQAPVQEGFHLAANMQKVHGRGQDDPVGGQEFVHDLPVVIVDPASSFLHAEGATGAVLDILAGKIDYLELETLLRKGGTEHFNHQSRVANPGMG
jgi:hypothetical protein